MLRSSFEPIHPELSTHMILALDFETANADPGSICSVGVASLESGRITRRREILIRPHECCGWFHPFNVSIHGIRPEMVRNAPEWDAVWPLLADHFRDSVVVAHNAAFDIGAFRRVMELYELELPEFPYFCSCKLARRLWPELENHRLNTLCRHVGFEFQHHQAGEAAAAAAFLVHKMLEFTGADDWQTLLEYAGVTPGRVSPLECTPCRVVPKKRRAR